MSAYRAVFVCEAGPGHGYGHFVRCLALGSELQSLRWQCQVAMSAQSATSTFVQDSPLRVVALDRGVSADALIAAFAEGPDLIFLDDYRIDYHDECQLSQWARISGCFDDFGDRRHQVDLIVNASPNADDARYDDLIPGTAKVLAGPAYAPLRREFHDQRQRRGDAFANRELRVGIGFGAVDSKGLAVRALSVVRERLPDCRVEIFAGSASTALATLQDVAARSDAVTLHIDCVHPAPTLAQCDFIIGAAGVSALERCALGLPAITVRVADNQRGVFDALSAAAAIVPIEFDTATFEERIGQAAEMLARDAAQRAIMGRRAAAYCDGRGAQRIAATINELIH